MSLRISVIVPSLSGGGAEFVARTWAEWLSGQGHEVAMVLTNGHDATRPAPAGVTALRALWRRSAGCVASSRSGGRTSS
jgi:hypothetical protein